MVGKIAVMTAIGLLAVAAVAQPAAAQCGSAFTGGVNGAVSQWESETANAQNFEDLLGAQGALVDNLTTATGNFVQCVIS